MSAICEGLGVQFPGATRLALWMCRGTVKGKRSWTRADLYGR